MRKPALIATLCALSVAATAFAVTPADAQQQRKRYVRSDQTIIVTRGEDGRTRTKVVVSPRSYLDGGTEVLPSQRKFNMIDATPYWSPIDEALGPGKNYDRQPLNPRWEQGWTRMLWN